MSDARIILWRDLVPRPWKNGGGETMDIAIHPANATLDDLIWRVSAATVASDGPFSTFAGVDRSLVVLDGDGIALTVGHGVSMSLDAGGEPFRFAGDIASGARLKGGPILDLNVMTRRDRAGHRVRRVEAGAPGLLRAAGHPTLLFVARGAVRVDGQQLDRFDAIVLAPGDAKVDPVVASLVYVIDIAIS